MGADRAPSDRSFDLAEEAAHELKNPLMGIRGLASTGLAAYDSLDDEERREFFRLIGQEAERLGRVIDQTSDLLHLREGAINYVLEPHDLASLLADAASADPRAELQDEQAASAVLCDRRVTAGVLAELVRNALTYSAPTSPVLISSSVPDATHVEVRVHDGGTGLTASDRERAFDAFTNARPGGFEHITGAGLGLHLAQAHIAAQGGRLWMAAGERGGTMLAFMLPRGGGGP